MRRRKALFVLWIGVALLALNAVLVVAQPGLALTRVVGQYVFGQQVIRAEVVLRRGNTVQAHRIDRGRIRTVLAGAVVLVERDGLVVTVPLAEEVTVVNARGRGRGSGALRRGMYVETIRIGDAPAHRVTVLRR